MDNSQMHTKSIDARQAQAVARAQAIVRRYVPKTVSLVDELTKDRQTEAAGE
jgi:hypothetical protein